MIVRDQLADVYYEMVLKLKQKFQTLSTMVSDTLQTAAGFGVTIS